MKISVIQLYRLKLRNPEFFFVSAVLFFLFFLLCTVPSSAHAHDPADTLKKEKKRLKNTIRFNLTNPLFFGSKSLLLGYERTIGKHQSFSLNLGSASFPKFFNPSFDFRDSSKIELTNNTSEKGFCGTVDYRFYLKKENKYDSPHGVYIGPYYSFTYFERINTWNLNTPHFNGELKTTYKININMVGFQLGYQFVFWKRVAFDCILFGPGVGSYKFTANVDTQLNTNDHNALLQKIQDSMENKFPGYNNIVNGDEFVKTGGFNTTSLGFRYVLHLGFRF